jgi:hypothetical protein
MSVTAVCACYGALVMERSSRRSVWFGEVSRPEHHTSVNVVLAGAHGVRAVRTIGDVHHLVGHAEFVTF